MDNCGLLRNRQIEVIAVGETGKSCTGKALRDSMVVVKAQGYHPQIPRYAGKVRKSGIAQGLTPCSNIFSRNRNKLSRQVMEGHSVGGRGARS